MDIDIAKIEAAVVREGLKEGYTASQIAGEFANCTRNAVIGVWHRNIPKEERKGHARAGAEKRKLDRPKPNDPRRTPTVAKPALTQIAQAVALRAPTPVVTQAVQSPVPKAPPPQEQVIEALFVEVGRSGFPRWQAPLFEIRSVGECKVPVDLSRARASEPFFVCGMPTASDLEWCCRDCRPRMYQRGTARGYSVVNEKRTRAFA